MPPLLSWLAAPPSYFSLFSAPPPRPHPNSSLRFSSCFFGAKFCTQTGLWPVAGPGGWGSRTTGPKSSGTQESRLPSLSYTSRGCWNPGAVAIWTAQLGRQGKGPGSPLRGR